MKPEHWIAIALQDAELIAKATTLAEAAPHVYRAAEHCGKAAQLPWGEGLLDYTADEVVKITNQLPPFTSFELRLMLAAVWLQHGRTKEGRRLADSLKDLTPSPRRFQLNLTPAFAIILADRPGSWRAWGCLQRLVDVRALAQSASNEVILALFTELEGTRDREQMPEFIRALSEAGRHSVLREILSLPLIDTPEENWHPLNSAAGIQKSIHQAVVKNMLRQKQLPEIQAYAESANISWRELCTGSDDTTVLRHMVETPPDEQFTSREWFRAAEKLAEKSKVTELLPYLVWCDDQTWKEETYRCEQLVDLAFSQREYKMAADLINHLPSGDAKPYRKKLVALEAASSPDGESPHAFLAESIADIKQGDFDSALEAARTALSLVATTKISGGKRTIRLQLAACLICGGAEKEGFALLKKLTQLSPDNDGMAEYFWVVLEACEEMQRLECFITASVDVGQRYLDWDWPGSHFCLALGHYYWKSSGPAAIALALSLPSQARETALEALLECAQDSSAADCATILHHLGPPTSEWTAACTVCAHLQKHVGPEASQELAKLLIEEVTTLGRTELIPAFTCYLESKTVEHADAQFPLIRLEEYHLRTLFSTEQWAGVREAKICAEYIHEPCLPQIRQYFARSNTPTAFFAELKKSPLKEAQERLPSLEVKSFRDVGTTLIQDVTALLQDAFEHSDLLGMQGYLKWLMEAAESPDLHDPSSSCVQLLAVLASFAYAGIDTESLRPRIHALAEPLISTCPGGVHRFINICIGIQDWESLAILLFDRCPELGFYNTFYHVNHLIPAHFFLQHRYEFSRMMSRAQWFKVFAELNKA